MERADGELVSTRVFGYNLLRALSRSLLVIAPCAQILVPFQAGLFPMDILLGLADGGLLHTSSRFMELSFLRLKERFAYVISHPG